MSQDKDKTIPIVLLAVKAINPFSKVMEMKLKNHGHQVYVAADIVTLRETAEKHTPDVILMDSTIEYAPELRQWLKGLPHRKLSSLVAIYPEEANPFAVSGFKVMDDEYLIEPYEIKTLDNLINSEYQRIMEERKHFVHSVKLQSSSDPIYIQEAGSFVEHLLKNTKLQEDDCLAVLNAAREALDNGARHGNNSNPEKKVSLEYVLDKKKIIIKVTDEGPGFDAGAYLGDGLDGDAVSVARKRKQQGKVGGLGLMLMLRCMDKVEFNRQGNSLTIVKNLENTPIIEG